MLNKAQTIKTLALKEKTLSAFFAPRLDCLYDTTVKMSLTVTSLGA